MYSRAEIPAPSSDMQSVMILSLPAGREPMIDLDQPHATIMVLVEGDGAAHLLPVV